MTGDPAPQSVSDPDRRGGSSASARSSVRGRMLGGATALASAALAGCVAGGSGTEALDLQPADPDVLVDRAAVTDHDREELLAAVSEAGTVAGTESEPPIEDGDVARAPDGSYHEIAVSSDTTRWIELAFGFETIDGTAGGDGGAESGDPESPIQTPELPATDLAVVQDALPASGTTSFDEDTTVSAVGRRVGGQENDASMLADADGRIIAHEGDQYRLHVRRATVGTKRTEYESTESWQDTAAYGEWLAEERAVELADLSDAERDVVEDAIDGQCKRDGTDSEAFDAVVATIRAAEPVQQGEGVREDDQWIVRWREQTYLASYEERAVPGGWF